MKFGRYIDHKYVRYTPLDALRRVGRFLRRFFSLGNVKRAFKNVIVARREYAVFFLALVAVQIIFWSVVSVFDSRHATSLSESDALSEWTFAIEGYGEYEWFDIYNRQLLVADNLEEDDRGYISYRAEPYSVFGERRYSVEFILPEDTYDACSSIITKYSLDCPGVTVRYSPSVEYGDAGGVDEALEAVSIIIAGAVSALMLLVLFWIRINHYKFKYGIYMSFGADFEKLFETAAWELFAIAGITFLPSAIIGIAGSALLVKLGGGVFALSAGKVVLAPFWTFIVVLIAVLPSVRILAVKTPVSLITAGDNSNLVSSPRRSKRLFGKKYPFHYEMLSFARFRRYYATLLSSAVLFSTVFLLFNFLSDMVTEEARVKKPLYTISAGEERVIDEYDLEELADLEGVDYILWEESVSAVGIGSHAVISREQASGILSKTVPAKQTEMYADNNFKYLYVNELMIRLAEENSLWQIEGDPRSALNEKNTVIVSEHISNAKRLNFEVGDKIIIAVFKKEIAPIDKEKMDRKYILDQQLNGAEFAFLEVTVGAVVDFGDTDDEYTIGLSPELYTDITGRSGGISEAEIYLADGVSAQTKQAVRAKARSMIGFYDGVVSDTNADFYAAVDEKCGYQNTLRVCGAAVLVIAPLVWFFSQETFNQKRRKEDYMLRAFGAAQKQIGKKYLLSGVLLAIPACFAATALSVLLCYLSYVFLNQNLTALGMLSGVRFEFDIPFWSFAVCAVLNAVCAIAATYLPYRKSLKEQEWS